MPTRQVPRGILYGPSRDHAQHPPRFPRSRPSTPVILTEPAAVPAPAAARSPAARAPRRLAFRLWIASILCWWIIGVHFSKLWWLVNATQLRWILFCYAWEAPAVGWTGAVALPYLILRRLLRRLDEGDLSAGKDLARFPARVAAIVLATSSIGYFLGAVQVGHFAYLPPLEFAKITLQGPVLGALFSVAAYLLAEEAIEGIPLPAGTPAAGPEVIHSLYGKVFGITVALTLGLSVPLFLYGLSQAQRQREEVRAHAMEQVLEGFTIRSNVEQRLSQFGPHTYGFIVRRSNNFVVGGKGAGTVLYGDGRRDFGIIQRSEHGWFASRDGDHKVVAFSHRPGVLPDGDGAIFVAVSPIQDYGAELLSASRTTATVAVGVLLIGLVLAGMMAYSIVRPIERLRATASQMAEGDRQVETMAMARGDEVAALARAFDQMAERVRTDEASSTIRSPQCSSSPKSCRQKPPGPRPTTKRSRLSPNRHAAAARSCATCSPSREAGRSRRSPPTRRACSGTRERRPSRPCTRPASGWKSMLWASCRCWRWTGQGSSKC